MIDLEEIRRRLRAVSDETGALAALTDADLLWLIANGWEPPGVEVPQRRSPATEGCFTLTTEQYMAYRRAVREAQEIKELLAIEERTSDIARDDGERTRKLRAALQRKAEELREMSAGWQAG